MIGGSYTAVEVAAAAFTAVVSDSLGNRGYLTTAHLQPLYKERALRRGVIGSGRIWCGFFFLKRAAFRDKKSTQ